MKKHKNDPKQSIYFDTNVIVGYFKKGDERKHSKGVIEKAATMIKNPDIMVKIPLISLGECAIWLLDHDNNGGLAADLRTLVKAKLNANTPPPDKRSYKIAFELMGDDGRIEPTDALIVAQALAYLTGAPNADAETNPAYVRASDHRANDFAAWSGSPPDPCWDGGVTSLDALKQSLTNFHRLCILPSDYHRKFFVR